jgi:hypothetical protein
MKLKILGVLLLSLTLQLQAQSIPNEEWIKPLEKNIESMALELEQVLNTSQPPKSIFNITKYGAVGDGKTLNTLAIQEAIDACSQSGGGRVLVPEGEYLSGTIVMKDNVDLHISRNAVLLGSPNPVDYLVFKGDFRNNTDRQVDKSLILAHKRSNIQLTGQGIIDFNGYTEIFQTGIGNDIRRPFGIRFISCKNILIEGLYLTNSIQWLQHYIDCDNLRIHNIKVYNHANKNNDGMDIDGCRNVLVSDCEVDSDDDAICLKSNGLSACENVLIKNCIAKSHCNALKMGTESTGGFKNVIIRDCQVFSPERNEIVNGSLRGRSTLTLIITDGGTMENILVKNIDSDGPHTPIYVTLGNRMRRYTKGFPDIPVGTIRNLKIADFTALGAGPETSSITGLNDEHQLENVILENINIELLYTNFNQEAVNVEKEWGKLKKGYPTCHVWNNPFSYGFYFRYTKGLHLQNIRFELATENTRYPARIVDCENVSVMNFKADVIDKSMPVIQVMRIKDYTAKY